MSVRRVLRDPVAHEVSPLELLFDLVFVLGVSQLTRHRSASSALNHRSASSALNRRSG
jgi:low temperature requirement protein LtrA